MSLFGKKYEFEVGYALSGGGSRGFAHLGALKALEHFDIKPDIISGTSAGALAGVFYADGFTPDEIIELFQKKAFSQFIEITLPRSGLFKHSGLISFLKKNLRSSSFEQLKTPFVAVTTDWERGRTVQFERGKYLVEAVAASCTVPVVFTPQIIEGVPYVDGGLLKNFPVSNIRKRCKTIVGVNVTLLHPKQNKDSIKYTMERSFNMMSIANTLIDRKLCDILIETGDLEQYSMFTLSNIEEIFTKGFNNTIKELCQKKTFEQVRRLAIRQRIRDKNRI